ELVLSNVGNSRQLCNTDVPVLNEGCIVVGNHEEVFQVQGGYSFSSIKKLKLRNLFEVRVIWNDFAEVVTLENLTTLSLRDCKKLRYIFSPMMARNLSHLEYLLIDGLFPFGYVPILPKLESLKLIMNSKLEEVFELEDEVEMVGEEEMKFDKLKWLSLEELPGLLHFCPKGYHSVFPAMIKLTVRDCPKLTTDFFIDS
ncbi:hypothetical protein Gotur_031741, partial [Gossypium turneri]